MANERFQFSKKQRQVLTWWRQNRWQAIICDGAVRSGKTFCMGLSFFLWAQSCFHGRQLALCGKTAGALRRNLLAETASKFWGLRQRVAYLTEPQLRRRILLFLRDRRETAGSDYFRVPYSRQEMAEVLGVNRSALSRELGRMQREGLLEFYRSSFRLKNV